MSSKLYNAKSIADLLMRQKSYIEAEQLWLEACHFVGNNASSATRRKWRKIVEGKPRIIQ